MIYSHKLGFRTTTSLSKWLCKFNGRPVKEPQWGSAYWCVQKQTIWLLTFIRKCNIKQPRQSWITEHSAGHCNLLQRLKKKVRGLIWAQGWRTEKTNGTYKRPLLHSKLTAASMKTKHKAIEGAYRHPQSTWSHPIVWTQTVNQRL